jgi:hypothetical protein
VWTTTLYGDSKIYLERINIRTETNTSVVQRLVKYTDSVILFQSVPVSARNGYVEQTSQEAKSQMCLYVSCLDHETRTQNESEGKRVLELLFLRLNSSGAVENAFLFSTINLPDSKLYSYLN